ncbi:MAG: UTP--glucose-1-phosphate uridylyltransferase GalU [Halofilum sp. (in: g-proteobacteria)]|nr:UTP--glucose-1-phosphate uridylyltransferase GalU [Halofilum sp. (in: g-proteobacteria)]
MAPVTKFVFPVAGMGTRFLPATKANPKEMLPVVDKPLVQYAAEEAVAAGAEVLVFITGRAKRAIPDHFDKAYELEAELEAKGKHEMLRVVRNVLPKGVDCVYLRQPQALGLGHAVLCARPVIGEEPFGVILADDLIRSEGPPAMAQMVEVHREHQASVLGVERVPKDATHRYGVVDSETVAEGLSRLRGIVEKPDPGSAPSNLAVVGRYILTPRIFELLRTQGRGAGGEIQLTDAIARLLEEEPVLAWEFEGRRFDCGDKLGYLQATVEYALGHPDLRDDFAAYLSGLDVSAVR